MSVKYIFVSLTCLLVFINVESIANDPPEVQIVSPEPSHQNIPVDLKFDPEVHRSGGSDNVIRPYGGDNFCNTWAANDKIYVTVDDGIGWPLESGSPVMENNNRVWALDGGPEEYQPEYLPGFPNYEMQQRWYAFGIVAVDGYLYYTISTPYKPDKRGIKLLYSPDFGKSWYRHDGTCDTINQYEENESTMFFFNEPDLLFSYIGFVQCGKDYQDSKDGYVYLYCKLTNPVPSIYLARVPKGHENIIDKSKYEYFQGYAENEKPEWTSEISRSEIIMSFPTGHYHSAFLPSVLYNKGLDLYIMALGARPEQRHTGGPSTLTFYWSKNPWGEWIPFYHNDCWIGDHHNNKLYQPKLVSKFTSEDGTTMYMNYSDCRNLWKDQYVYNQQKLTLELGGTVFFKEGDDISFRAKASDPDGSIARVEFYANFSKLGQDTTPGYEFVSKNVPAGNYRLTVLAHDNEGATSASSIHVIVLPK